MKTLARTAYLLLALSSLSCAASSMNSVPNPMPAARAGLPQQFRIFYDALADYGEWTLIEPYGYVFRPNVSHIGWQPYEYGFWVPNDTFGWVWVSSEPFGWATFHYGTWMFDRYEGWVWIPGLDWGPAWVDWQMAGDYAGWSPLGPGNVPGGPSSYQFVALRSMAATDLATHRLSRDEVKQRATTFERIVNPGEANGVKFNRGPSFDLVQKQSGSLARARIADIAPPAGAPSGGDSHANAAIIEAARRAADAAAVNRRIAEAGAAPPSEVSLLRLTAQRLAAAGRAAARADSTRR